MRPEKANLTNTEILQVLTRTQFSDQWEIWHATGNLQCTLPYKISHRLLHHVASAGTETAILEHLAVPTATPSRMWEISGLLE